jgi:hypothetical protein
VNDVSGAYARSTLAGVTASTDVDLLTSYTWGSSSPQAYFNVFLRGTGGWQNAYRPNNGYGLSLTATSATVSVQKNVNGVLTTLQTVSGGQRVTTSQQWLRLRVQGQSIMFRTWPAGTSEPTLWMYSATDSSLAGTGRPFVSLVRSSSNTGIKTLTLDDLTLSAP